MFSKKKSISSIIIFLKFELLDLIAIYKLYIGFKINKNEIF